MFERNLIGKIKWRYHQDVHSEQHSLVDRSCHIMMLLLRFSAGLWLFFLVLFLSIIGVNGMEKSTKPIGELLEKASRGSDFLCDRFHWDWHFKELMKNKFTRRPIVTKGAARTYEIFKAVIYCRDTREQIWVPAGEVFSDGPWYLTCRYDFDLWVIPNVLTQNTTIVSDKAYCLTHERRVELEIGPYATRCLDSTDVLTWFLNDEVILLAWTTKHIKIPWRPDPEPVTMAYFTARRYTKWRSYDPEMMPESFAWSVKQEFVNVIEYTLPTPHYPDVRFIIGNHTNLKDYVQVCVSNGTKEYVTLHVALNVGMWDKP